MTSPVLNTYKTACDFLSWQRLFHLLHLQPPIKLVPMMTYGVMFKLAELVPSLSPLLSQNVVALYIRSSTNKDR